MNGTATARNRRLSASQESGLGLIEVMVSMALFLTVTVGVAGTLAAGLKATTHSRMQTIGKSMAQEQIEEMRSRVFYVPFSQNPDTGTVSDIDLLDVYFPNLRTGAADYGSGWSGRYDGATSAFIMESVPDDRIGVLLTVETRFVDDAARTVTPAADYDSDMEGRDTPPGSLVAVRVTASWSEPAGEMSYQLDSLISATGQSTQGAGDASGEQGCTSTSNSDVSAGGSRLRISTGIVGAYSDFLQGATGTAHTNIYSGCENGATATVGDSGISRFDDAAQTFVPLLSGATASASGPMGIDSDGPFDAGPTAGWPSGSIFASGADASARATEALLDGAGESRLEGMSVSLGQVEGSGGDPVTGYRSWDFVNPVIAFSGGTDVAETDPALMDDQAAALIEQLDGVTEARGKVYIGQVEILPLEATSPDTPSALQGIFFVRDFRAEATSEAGGSADNPVTTYSATIGIFNAESGAGCSGDGCYDLYATVGPENPVQTAINLSASRYSLQKALLTGWRSLTAADIMRASTASADGTSASVDFGSGAMDIAVRFGAGVLWKTENPHRDEITLLNEQGLAHLWLGEISTSLHQE